MKNQCTLVAFVVLVCVFFTACTSKETLQKARNEKLAADSKILNYNPDTDITHIDGTIIRATDLDSRIKVLMQAAKVSGIAVAIINNNKISYIRAFGCADRQDSVPLQINDVFYGASLSKAVFGYLVAQLVSKGIIDLDKPLQQYLPMPIWQLKANDKWHGFADLKDDERAKLITARMCLTHTTGLQNWRWIPRPDDTGNKKTLKIYFEPGTQYYYSGEGIMLLQYVIEQVTGKGLEQLGAEYVFGPLKMRNTSYVWQQRFDDNHCLGHNPAGEVTKREKRQDAGAAGSMQTNLIDYALFVQHILQLTNEHSPLTELMFKPSFPIRTKTQFGPSSILPSSDNDGIQLNYGLGWGLLQLPVGYAAFKEGHGDGFQHYSIIFPDRKTGMIILSNSDNAEGIFKELLSVGIGDVYTPWQWENYIPYNAAKQ